MSWVGEQGADDLDPARMLLERQQGVGHLHDGRLRFALDDRRGQVVQRAGEMDGLGARLAHVVQGRIQAGVLHPQAGLVPGQRLDPPDVLVQVAGRLDGLEAGTGRGHQDDIWVGRWGTRVSAPFLATAAL